MDLMIDCMPLYEMIEDDMKNIINCSMSSSSSSPSCLSDEEQLALTSCSMFDDLLFLSTTNFSTAAAPNQQTHFNNNSSNLTSAPADPLTLQPLDRGDFAEITNNQNNNQNNTNNNSNTFSYYNNNNNNNNNINNNSNNCTLSLNDSFNSSSLSSSYSSTVSSAACSPISVSNAASPLSLSSSSSSLCAALASTTFNKLSSASSSPSSFSSSSICSSVLSSPPATPLPHQQYNSMQQQTVSSNINTSPTVQTLTLNKSDNAKYMQDPYLSNNFNLYHVINPMDLNRNYNNNNNNSDNQSQYTQMNIYDTNNSDNSIKLHVNSLQIPVATNGRLKSNISIAKHQSPCSNYTQQLTKRGKYCHDTVKVIEGLDDLVQTNDSIKLESKFHSDGESSLSNESDSNCSSSSLINLNLENQQQQQQEQIFINTLSQSTSGVGDFSKQLIIATKVEPFQLKNLTNCAHKLNDELTFSNSNNVNTPAQFNLIKMNNPKENLTANSFYNNSMQTTGTLKLPITTKINSLVDHNPNGNHKTIIQYKQLLTTNLNNSLKQPTIIASNSQQQQQQQQNNNSLISLNAVSMTSNVNDSNTTGNCDFLQLISTSVATNNNNNSTTNSKIYPKPPYSYSCLIAMALRNSDSGTLPVSDIYEFIIENFPYYKTARDGWKNSIRHNLSLNKCFEKIENPTNGSKKGCLWALNPDKCKKLEEECKRCRQRDPVNIRLSMSRPDDLNKIERGEQRLKKFPIQNNQNQRKLIDSSTITLTNNNNNNNNNSNNNNVSVMTMSPTTNGSISLSPAPNNASNNNQILNDDAFLLEWTNKNASIILKEEV